MKVEIRRNAARPNTNVNNRETTTISFCVMSGQKKRCTTFFVKFVEGINRYEVAVETMIAVATTRKMQPMASGKA